MTVFETLWFWGCFGLVTELVFTALRKLVAKSAFSQKEWALVGHTSLWMFPIYALGLSYGFDFLVWLISNDLVRWSVYPLCIWAVELGVSRVTDRWKIKLWSYEYLPDWAHYRGIISYVHYPLWAIFGIIVETIK